MNAALAAFGLVFVAELGDKSQLLALSLAARHRALPVLAGLAAGQAAVQGLAVLLGGLLGVALPDRPIAVGAGVLFLVFAAVSWRSGGDDGEDDAGRRAGRDGRSPLQVVVLVAWTIAVGELGDKTMLTSATLAAREAPLAVWIGGTLGLIAAGAGAVLVGREFGRRLPTRLIERGAAVVFAVVGVLLVADGLAG
jgi:putative Ca2+/H+ antiporter (TMEM165/GDT1 family)